MFRSFRLGRRAMPSCGLTILLALTIYTPTAAANVWQDTFGQRWFYETRSSSGEMLAGTWWEGSLTPGKTYRIEFKVNSLRGRLAVLAGDNDAEIVDRTGAYAYEFTIRSGGKRRMLFQSRSANMLAGVSGIAVTERTNSAPSPAASTSDATPRGHYLSFARTRNLRNEVTAVLDHPASASTYQRRQAERIDQAFRTPGVKGFWMAFDWGDVEVADGRYDWRTIDANMDVARRYGIKLLVKIGDRSFDGSHVVPRYFPSRYELWTIGGGHTGYVSRRWDPYVYSRLIRLYRNIVNRYASHPGFGGIASTETALGNVNGGDYSVAKYKNALVQIATQTQSFMPGGRKLFFYVNFIRGGDDLDMNQDARIDVLKRIPRQSVVAGGPDVTPDRPGMPGSVNSFRVHARRTMGNLHQFCHFQHVDQGLNGLNVKSNVKRNEFRQRVARLRDRESKPWFKATPGIYVFDDLRDPQGRKVDQHPDSIVGKMWRPEELLEFGARNFGCEYAIWHFREHPKSGESGWEDIRPVILNHQYFYM